MANLRRPAYFCLVLGKEIVDGDKTEIIRILNDAVLQRQHAFLALPLDERVDEATASEKIVVWRELSVDNVTNLVSLVWNHRVNTCDPKRLHTTLELYDQQAQIGDSLHVIWFTHTSQEFRENPELHGAMLCAQEFHGARIVQIGDSSFLMTALITEATYLPDLSSYNVPVWCGYLESINTDDVTLDNLCNGFYEVFLDNHSTDSIEEWTRSTCSNSFMTIIGKIDISDVHGYMLGIKYRVQITPPDGSNSMCLTHWAIEPQVALLLRLSYTTADVLKSPGAVKTEESWMSHVLKMDSVGSCRRKWKVPETIVQQFQFFVLFGHEGNMVLISLQSMQSHALHHYLDTCLSLDSTCPSLHSACLSQDSTCISERGISGRYEETQRSCCRLSDIYSQLALKPHFCHSPDSILHRIQDMRDMISNCSSSSFVERFLENSASWPERLALQHRDSENQKGIVQPTTACYSTDTAWSAERLLSHFQDNGLSHEPRFHLPTGNREKDDLRRQAWPLSKFYFGPGYCYHDDGDERDSLLQKFRERQHFIETLSLYNTNILLNVSPVMGGDNSNCLVKMPVKENVESEKQTCDEKSDKRKSRVQGRSLTGHRNPDTEVKRPSKRIKSERRQSYRNTINQVSDNSAASQESRQSTQSADAITQGTGSTTLATTPVSTDLLNDPESKAERNRRNKQRMMKAVDEALAKLGVFKGQSCYSECSKQLYSISVKAVQKLKTSHNLDKKMTEISNMFAGAIVATFKD